MRANHTRVPAWFGCRKATPVAKIHQRRQLAPRRMTAPSRPNCFTSARALTRAPTDDGLSRRGPARRDLFWLSLFASRRFPAFAARNRSRRCRIAVVSTFWNRGALLEAVGTALNRGDEYYGLAGSREQSAGPRRKKVCLVDEDLISAKAENCFFRSAQRSVPNRASPSTCPKGCRTPMGVFNGDVAPG
jgi:hypothetical protein